MSEVLDEALVVCTKDRPGRMESLLAVLPELDVLPRLIVVVDSSSFPSTEQHVRVAERPLAELGSSLHYVRSRVAGLPAQRNLGVETTAARVVHFLDDDVVPAKNYFDVLSAYMRDPASDGVGIVAGVNLAEDTSVRGVALRRALRGYARPGAVSPGGVNFPAGAHAGCRPVEWVHGCAFSVRREVLRDFRFNVLLQDLPAGGVGVGEDVDFCLRAGRRWAVISNGNATYRHLPADEGRPTSEDWHTSRRLLRRALVGQGLTGGRMLDYYLAGGAEWAARVHARVRHDGRSGEFYAGPKHSSVGQG
jgi:GT2 family glycosyltransferase